MPTTIYDSSLITQRRRDKAVSGSFISRISPWNVPPPGSSTNQPNTGSAPMAGITEQSIINTVINGQMTDYRKNDGGCTTISPGCPCSTSAVGAAALLPPGIVTNVQYSYGSIIATWDAPTTGGPALSYNVNLIPSPGLSFTVYQNYFNDNVNFFAAATPISGVNSGNTNNLSTLTTSTPGVTLPANNFSAQWLGYFYATETGIYTFRTTSDDASYVWIGSNATSGFTTSNAVVNNGGQHPNITQSGTVSLTAGTFYPIRVQYGEATLGQDFTLEFKLPSAPPLSFISSGAYFFQGLPISATTGSTNYTFPNNLLTPTANYYLSVNAENSAGQGPVGFYLSGGNPGLITSLYNPPTMGVLSTTSNTCTISYSFSTLPGIGFTVTGATASPALPSGWTLTANNSQIVLTKATPNPASLPSTQKFSLTGANPGETTYPSNAISGITTLGVVPSISLTGGTSTTAVLLIATPYTGFTPITGVSVDPTTPLPSNWSFTSFTGGNTITLTWNGSGTSLISSGIKFILTDGTVNSPASNAVSGIDISIFPPVPSFLTGTNLFTVDTDGNAIYISTYSFTTPNYVTDLCIYEGANSWFPEESWSLYTIPNPTDNTTNLSNLSGNPYNPQVANVTTYNGASYQGLTVMFGTGYDVAANYTNPVLVNTSPTNLNYNVKFSNLPANTTFYLRGLTVYDDLPGPPDDRYVALACFIGSNYLQQLTLTPVNTGVVLFSYVNNSGNGDGEITGPSTITYPILVYNNPEFSYPSPYTYKLAFDPINNKVIIKDGNVEVVKFSFNDTGTDRYLCSSDIFPRNTVGNCWFTTQS